MVGLLELFCILLVLAFVLLVLGLIIIYITTDSMPNLKRYDSEKYFKDPNRGGSKKEFPSIQDKATKNLSVIVPSYNEEERLPTMLDETLAFLEERLKKESSLTFEIIVVDDGSRDKTSKVALDYSKKYGIDKVRVLTLAKNRGKGGAVRLGVLSARGEYILFADADGATNFPDIVKLESAIKQINNKHNMKIVCGSRAHLQEEAVAKRSVFRTILMYGFHFAVMILCQVKGVKDTQCGFKLFSREAAFRTFYNLHVERWAFDVELLYIAEQLGISPVEVAVNWTEIDGSKMIPVWSWIQMGKDLLLIRLRYLIGVWKIDRTIKS
ncbi:dolichyl-phosphate beta-glucosyltransferase-like [Saccoglossus kowalevskii]|uniref:dolichyl-phosphate beta-glucosyltransferase n=1 Tax=Saccoglossus kowalevskii TaxID=10224 RepID=A0ABM0M3J5_SACKO|nr:PREDICTED: dolichyl-phosphate beta-glucosyltransferase-like [Saccoglossus kowalevskii]